METLWIVPVIIPTTRLRILVTAPTQAEAEAGARIVLAGLAVTGNIEPAQRFTVAAAHPQPQKIIQAN